MRKTLIGRKAEVVDARNRSLVGIAGKVVDESKNTLAIETRKGRKKVIKAQVTLKIDDQVIEGKSIAKKIEERMKI